MLGEIVERAVSICTDSDYVIRIFCNASTTPDDLYLVILKAISAVTENAQFGHTASSSLSTHSQVSKGMGKTRSQSSITTSVILQEFQSLSKSCLLCLQEVLQTRMVPAKLISTVSGSEPSPVKGKTMVPETLRFISISTEKPINSVDSDSPFLSPVFNEFGMRINIDLPPTSLLKSTFCEKLQLSSYDESNDKNSVSSRESLERLDSKEASTDATDLKLHELRTNQRSVSFSSSNFTMNVKTGSKHETDVNYAQYAKASVASMLWPSKRRFFHIVSALPSLNMDESKFPSVKDILRANPRITHFSNLQIAQLQQQRKNVFLSLEVEVLIDDIIDGISLSDIVIGSPGSSARKAFIRLLQAMSVLERLSYCSTDLVLLAAPECLGHRLSLDTNYIDDETGLTVRPAMGCKILVAQICKGI